RKSPRDIMRMTRRPVEIERSYNVTAWAASRLPNESLPNQRRRLSLLAESRGASGRPSALSVSYTANANRVAAHLGFFAVVSQRVLYLKQSASSRFGWLRSAVCCVIVVRVNRLLKDSRACLMQACAALGILMYSRVHCGSCAPGAPGYC